MELLVSFALGGARIDVDEGSWEASEVEPPLAVVEAVDLPLVIAAVRCGARIVALVDRRPPLVVSDDAGSTWRELGGGLPAGVAIAISPDHPDQLAYATADRLFISRDGGRFWSSLPLELPGIERVSFVGN